MASRIMTRPLTALATLPLAVPLAVLLAAPVAANNRPHLTVTPTVSGTTATVDVAINRGKQAIATCSFVLDAAAATGCGDPIDGGKKAASFGLGLSGLRGGSHTVTVTDRPDRRRWRQQLGFVYGGRGPASLRTGVQQPRRRAWLRLDPRRPDCEAGRHEPG